MSNVKVSSPPGANTDWTIPQDWQSYAPAEHGTWNRLCKRRSKMLAGRVSSTVLQGLAVLRMSKPGVPDFDELSVHLHRVFTLGAQVYAAAKKQAVA